MKNRMFFGLMVIFFAFGIESCKNAALPPTTSKPVPPVKPNNQLVSPENFCVVKQGGEKGALSFQWNRRLGADKYWIEAKLPEGDEWKREMVVQDDSSKEILTATFQKGMASEHGYNFYDDKIASGEVYYYRLSAVDKYGLQGDCSHTVAAALLAPPEFGEIPEIEGGKVSLSWNFNHIFSVFASSPSGSSSYEDDLFFDIEWGESQDELSDANVEYKPCDEVYVGENRLNLVEIGGTKRCLIGAKKIADGEGFELDPATKSFSAEIGGLPSNTNVWFKVNAHINLLDFSDFTCTTGNKRAKERLTPDCAKEFKVSDGVYSDKIALAWNCPQKVDCPIDSDPDDGEPDGKCDVLFKIQRRLSGTDTFGQIDVKGEDLDGATVDESGFIHVSGGYEAGKTVYFFDRTAKDELQYDYKIVSYSAFDPTKYTETEAQSGKKMGSIKGFSLNNSEYEQKQEQYRNGNKPEIDSCNVKFSLDWQDPQGGFDSERYSVALERKSVSGDSAELFEGLSIADKKIFKDGREFTAAVNYDRSVAQWVYVVKVICKSAVSEGFPEDDFVFVCAETSPVTFTTAVAPKLNQGDFKWSENCYSNKATFSVNVENEVKYSIGIAEDGAEISEDGYFEIADIHDAAVAEWKGGNLVVGASGLALGETMSLDGGKKYYAVLRAERDGITVNSDKVAFVTLGTPTIEPRYTSASYSSIILDWSEVEGASSYVLTYSTQTEGEKTETFAKDNLGDFGKFSNGQFSVAIPHPDASNPAQSGKPIQVALRAIGAGNSEEETSGETNCTAETNLLGPALLSPKASQFESGKKITLTWNPVPGAKGYRIWRKQNIDGEEGKNTSQYLCLTEEADDRNVKATDDMGGFHAVSGKEFATLSKPNENKAYFTFEDNSQTNLDACKTIGNVYAEMQTKMCWSASYDYYVFPIYSEKDEVFIEEGDAISVCGLYPLENLYPHEEKDGETDGTEPIAYRGAVLGYARNVKAAKGEVRSSEPLSEDECKIGDVISAESATSEINITWEPPRAEGIDSVPVHQGYDILRREKKDLNGDGKVGDDEWGSWQSIRRGLSATSFNDENAAPYTAYEYLVVANASGGSQKPTDDAEYLKKIEPSGDNFGVKFGGVALDDMWPATRSATFEPTGAFPLTDKEDSGAVSARLDVGGKATWRERISWHLASNLVSFPAGTDGETGEQLYKKYLPSGFVLEVQNDDVDKEWRVAADLPVKASDITDNVAFCAAVSGWGYDGRKEGDERFDHKQNFLKVLCNYKHNWRVREYVVAEKDGEKLRHYFAPSDTAWGARQISDNEFLWLASDTMREGIDKSTGWQSHYGKWWNYNNSVYSQSSFGVGMWGFAFVNYKHNLLTVDGRLGAETSGAGGKPRSLFSYMSGSANGTKISGYDFLVDDYKAQDHGNGKIQITGPSDLNGLYNGFITFTDCRPSNGGKIEVWHEDPNVATTYTDGYKNHTTLPHN